MKFTLTLQPKFRIMNRIIYFLLIGVKKILEIWIFMMYLIFFTQSCTGSLFPMLQMKI